MRTSVRTKFGLTTTLWLLAACGDGTSAEPGLSSSAEPSTGAPVTSDVTAGVEPTVGSSTKPTTTGESTATPTGATGSVTSGTLTQTQGDTGPTTTAPTPTDQSSTTPSEAGTSTQGPSESTAPPVNPEPLVRPSLVTSGQGAYWTVGEVSDTPQANPDLTVDLNTQHQTWLGFGGSFNEQGWDALSAVSAEERQRAVALLFDKASGAGLEFGRVPIGASDYAVERYSLNETPDDFGMDNFSIDHDRALLIPFIKAALAVNPNIRLWASPWTPPSWMKTNGKLDGTSKRVDGSTVDNQPDAQMKGEPAILDAFALYLARFVEDYAAEDITIESVMPQNEPGYSTRYPSCLWSADVMRTFVADHLGPLFNERGIDAEIWFGTMSNADAGKDGDLLNAITADATAMTYVKGFGLQWNMINHVNGLKSKNLPILQTEHKCGNYPFTVAGAPPFNPNQPPNDHAYGEESFLLIRDWLEAGVNSYSAWNMVLDKYGKNLDFDRPWPQNALLVVDRDTGTLTATPAYYVFRHFSYFIDPGAVRVGTSGNANALAFKNPDGGVITVVYNNTEQAKPTVLGIGDARVQFEVPARGWATVNWH